MRIGYARVSTEDQNLALQHDALKAAGCETIFDDHIRGTVAQRPGLDAALAQLVPGDALVVWRLDRLARSLPHLLQLSQELRDRHVDLVSLSEAIDTTTATGELVFAIFGAIAQFERRLIVERTNAGIAAARRRGRHIGRPLKLNRRQIEHARAQINAGETVATMADLLQVNPSTLRRALAAVASERPEPASDGLRRDG